MCYQFCKGLNEVIHANEKEFDPRKILERNMFCNLRFNRNFTKGHQGPWIINYVNYFHYVRA